MKQMLKKVFSMVALLSAVSAQAVTPYYSIRSQGVDAARELSGWTQQVNLFDKDCLYGTFALTTEYAQSFNANNISQCLFGTAACNNSCSNTVLNVSGSRVVDRGANDLFADYFYLPTDFQSTLNFSPTIQNVVVDLNFYVGLDNWASGMFFRLDLPINWTRWNLNFCENVVSTGTLNYDSGYFNSFSSAPAQGNVEGIGVPRSNLLNSFSQYACGYAPAAVSNLDSVVSGSTVFDPLCYAKISGCAQSTTRLADLQMILGWNFVQCEDYHVGLGILARAPTGNRPTAQYLFEPISGNGGSWELGFQFTSHATLWRCESEEKSLGFYLDANITHLFNANQVRTFDLSCKPLSRYMLAEKLTTSVVDLAGSLTGAPGANIPSAQFANEFSPVANLTTQQVNVSVGVQGDVAAQFTYVHGGWNLDIGYNFWGRSCEKFNFNNCPPACAPCPTTCATNCPTTCPSPCANVAYAPSTWALKGDAYVYGFNFNDDLGMDQAVPLSATESLATINAGTTFPATGVTSSTAAYQTDNSGVDAAQPAFFGTGSRVLHSNPDNTDGQTNTSVNPVFISCANFDFAGTCAISNKIYTHLSYNWTECDVWAPYLGVGAFGEFGSNGANCNTNCTPTVVTTTTAANCCNTSCNTNCSNCNQCSLSQWGVWIKGGVSFN